MSTKSVYQIEISVSLFYGVFGSKATIFCLNSTEHMDLFIAVYRMS